MFTYQKFGFKTKKNCSSYIIPILIVICILEKEIRIFDIFCDLYKKIYASNIKNHINII